MTVDAVESWARLEDEVVAARKSGMKKPEVCARFGIGGHAYATIMRRHGLPGYGRLSTRLALVGLEEEVIAARKAGASIDALARRYDVSGAPIRRILAEAGLAPPRSDTVAGRAARSGSAPTSRFRPTTPFEAYLMETRRVQLATARHIAGALAALIHHAGVEEVLAGNLDEIVESHPRVVKAKAERRRPCKHRHALIDAGRAFRAFVEAGGEVPS